MGRRFRCKIPARVGLQITGDRYLYDRKVSVFVLCQQSEPHHFASDRDPLITAVLPANAIGGKLRVFPASNLLRVPSCQYLGNVPQADAEPAFLFNALDARE